MNHHIFLTTVLLWILSDMQVAKFQPPLEPFVGDTEEDNASGSGFVLENGKF